MSLRNLIGLKPPRKKNVVRSHIEYDSSELRNFVNDWLKSQGWELSNFDRFLEAANVYNPKIASDLNGNTFKCTTVSNREVWITLFVSGSYTREATLSVVDGKEERRYEINKNIPNEETTPKARLNVKILRDNGSIRELRNYYGKGFIYRTLKLTSFSRIDVEIEGEFESKWTIKDHKIEQYLMHLNNEVTASDIFYGICNLVPEIKEKSTKIEISCVKKADGEDKIVDWIMQEMGKIWQLAKPQ